VEAEEGVPDILRIPRPLQESFFELARREADRVLREISAISEPLKRAYETVRPHLRKLHKRV
jgi:broad specificity phosphatase PhoE